MAKADSRRPYTVEAWVDSGLIYLGFVIGKVTMGLTFL